MGKTTLTVGVAAALSLFGNIVLLVDSDPQCNLTSYLVEEDVVDDMLDRSDSDDGKTLWSALKPVVEATGGTNTMLLLSDYKMSFCFQETFDSQSLSRN